MAWRIKYLDAEGRQVKETLGREPDWDRRKARRSDSEPSLGRRRQAKAGHAHGSTTERYLHAHRTSYPQAAELAESRLFT